MRHEVVLLKAVEGSRVGWLLMGRDEFLERIDLKNWDIDQVLIGTMLPAARPPYKAN